MADVITQHGSSQPRVCHRIGQTTSQDNRRGPWQNAFPLPEGPGPVTEQRGLVEVSRGGKELGAEPKSRRKDTRDGDEGKMCQAQVPRGQKGRDWKAKERGWEADYSFSYLLRHRSSPSGNPLAHFPSLRKCLLQFCEGGTCTSEKRLSRDGTHLSLAFLSLHPGQKPLVNQGSPESL